ncbi:hypothetical protein GGI42DRAFT_330578 [Trichoderma sp. SZMC 28013]
MGWDGLGSAGLYSLLYMLLDLCWACKSSACKCLDGDNDPQGLYPMPIRLMQYGVEYAESSVPVHNVQWISIQYAICTITASASLCSTLPASTCRQRTYFSLYLARPRRCYRRSATSTTDPEALPAKPWRGCTGYPIAMFRPCGPAMAAQPSLYRSGQVSQPFFSFFNCQRLSLRCC